MVENSMTLAAWLVSEKPFCVKEFQKTLFTLSQIPDENAHYNYESAWRNWASQCLERKISFPAPVKDIIKYLTFLFNYGNEYRTTNLHRSAISAFCECIDGFPVEKHFRIVPGLFSLRLSKLRYMFVWDVKQILDFVKEKFGDNDQLSNKELTLKVTILLTLTTSYRISTLYILDLNHMIKKKQILSI